jgi:predicted O-methyltransferase YrrM
MSSVLGDKNLEGLLDRLHARSDGQIQATSDYFRQRAERGELSWEGMDEGGHRFMSDKLVALDRDKAEFCYLLCRALGARRVVEAGSSLGVSTLYLAAAVRDNGGGLAEFIDLRQGDLRETLKEVGGLVDFMLIDIWVEMARPALELVSPHLRVGAVVVADNTAAVPEPYRAYFEFLADPKNRFRTQTLPFQGGLELTVRCA